jgi:hypothetical protein
MLIFSDESINYKIKVVGSISISKDDFLDFESEVLKLRLKHNDFEEIKWIDQPKSRTDFYFEVIDLFFKTKSLAFHSNSFTSQMDQHEVQLKLVTSISWKMFFDLGYKQECFAVLDKINKKSKEKVEALKPILENKKGSLKHYIKVSEGESHLTSCMQVADLFTGCLSYELNKEEIILKKKNNKFKDQFLQKLILLDTNQPLSLSSSNPYNRWKYDERKFQHYNLHKRYSSV